MLGTALPEDSQNHIIKKSFQKPKPITETFILNLFKNPRLEYLANNWFDINRTALK